MPPPTLTPPKTPEQQRSAIQEDEKKQEQCLLRYRCTASEQSVGAHSAGQLFGALAQARCCGVGAPSISLLICGCYNTSSIHIRKYYQTKYTNIITNF
ncbi:unnamed protein product [Ceratitis capitata]|uniref:(Mediterranean fruit fly) hypothetical protein n=1 Tax=Ceratitis capitata TaxID=7213 RepID=A0A811VDB6_CERCA|nr:unnamed protein product [Ceratitis capitata]